MDETQQPAPARCPIAVMAGGKSTRLGRDKASEVLAGKTLLQRVLDACAPLASRFIIVTARGQRLPEVASDVPLMTVEDAYPESGPLGGIYTALRALEADGGQPPVLVVACDMPLLQARLLRELLRLAPGHDAAVPVKDGLPEPLCAVYTLACIDPARRLLERGANKVAGLLESLEALRLPESHWRPFDPDGLSFLNINREEDLERARTLVDSSATSDEGLAPPSTQPGFRSGQDCSSV